MSHPLSQPAARSERALPLLAIGRVKRTYPAAAAGRGCGACNDAEFRPLCLADDFVAWAARSAAASGFGDAVVAGPPPAERFVAHGAFAAGAAINASLAAIATAVSASTSRWARGVLASWRRRRTAQATVDALRSLDARTLRDLGIEASEIRSVAVELSGMSNPTRAHALVSVRNLAI